jgi:hypothetical protein
MAYALGEYPVSGANSRCIGEWHDFPGLKSLIHRFNAREQVLRRFGLHWVVEKNLIVGVVGMCGVTVNHAAFFPIG